MAARKDPARWGSGPGTAASAGGSAPTDLASMRRSNMALILRYLRDHGGRSRAALAAGTGLSKATMSSLVADLVSRGLVAEGELHRRGTVGRPGQTITLAGSGVGGVGVEVNVDHLVLVVLDLTGSSLVEVSRPLDTVHLEPLEVVEQVADLVRGVLETVRASDVLPVGMTVAAPGFVEVDSGAIRLAPNLGWRDVPLAAELGSRLGGSVPFVRVENDAKLGAVAELAQLAGTGIDDLLYIAGDVGVGGGIISRGQILYGADGFAGEIGHMPLDPEMPVCVCGRRGCWETMVGLSALMRRAADPDDPVRDAGRPLEDRLLELRRRAEDGDERTLAALAAVADGLGTGVAVLVDALNPAMVVLGGYFSWFEEHLVAPVQEVIVSRRLTTSADTCPVVGSRLGLTSSARGAAYHSLEAVFEDPTLVPVRAPA
jgi:predicted NBD/HSP70 family sugar kinase